MSLKELIPNLLLDPLECNITICKITKKKTKKGRIKWREKKRLTVTTLTISPPQINLTKKGPKIGISLNKLVITDAPQKDIWFIGRTYPKNETAIINKRIKTPTNQVLLLKKLL